VFDLNDETDDDAYLTENEENKKSAERKNGSVKSKRLKRIAEPRFYLKSWETLSELKSIMYYFSYWFTYLSFKFIIDWLAPVAKNPKKAWCKYCKCEILARCSDLKIHAKCQKHLNSVNYAKTEIGPSNIVSHMKGSVADELKIAELKISAFIANSNIAFRNIDVLVKLISNTFKKDELAKKLKVIAHIY